MQHVPSEMERRYRLYMTGRGDSGASLFLCLLEGGGGSRAWAAHVLSRIFIAKGRMSLAHSFLDVSTQLFMREGGGSLPPALHINRALILWVSGYTSGAEGILKGVLEQSIKENQILLAAETAAILSTILASLTSP